MSTGGNIDPNGDLIPDPDPPAETLEQQQQRLRDALEQLEQQQREQAEHERQLQQAARQAELSPELQAQAAEIERLAKEELDRDYPPPWKPADSSHPQELVGMIERINPSVGPSPEYGTFSMVIEIATITNERWSVWAQHGTPEHPGVIYSSMIRSRLQPGEIIAIRHLGMKRSDSTGFEYRNFKVRRVTLDRDSEPGRVDYDQLTKQTQEQAALPAPATAGDEPDDIPF